MFMPVSFPLFLGSPMEVGLVFLVVLILFGPGKLPEVFRSLGEGVRKFKEASNGNLETTPTVPTLPRSDEPKA